MEGIDSELIFMNSVHTTRMLDEVNPKSIADNAALLLTRQQWMFVDATNLINLACPIPTILHQAQSLVYDI